MEEKIIKYVSLMTDFGFKKVLGDSKNKALLINLVNGLLPKKHQIIDLRFNKNEQLGKTKNARSALFDLYCTTSNGEEIIIEMQKPDLTFLRKDQFTIQLFQFSVKQ